MYCSNCGIQISDDAKFCPECGTCTAPGMQQVRFTKTVVGSTPEEPVHKAAKNTTAKLVIGILCIVISLLIFLQSCAVGAGNAFLNNNEGSGGAGIIVALLMLAGGIVTVATRNTAPKGGSMACFIMYGIAALMGSALSGSFTDLRIWAGLCLILAIINIIWYLKAKKI